MKGIDSTYTEQIYNLLRKKYIEAIRIYDLTEQMSSSLNHNDVISTQLYLNMRQDVIITAANVDDEIYMIISSMPEEWQERMRQLLSSDWKDLIIQDAAESKLGEEWERVRRQMQKTIELDKRFSQKVGGKNSYYAQ